jgi:hypothetical protein
VPKVVRRVGMAAHPKKGCAHLSQIRSREQAHAGPGVMPFTRPAQDGSAAGVPGRALLVRPHVREENHIAD